MDEDDRKEVESLRIVDIIELEKKFSDGTGSIYSIPIAYWNANYGKYAENFIIVDQDIKKIESKNVILRIDLHTITITCLTERIYLIFLSNEGWNYVLNYWYNNNKIKIKRSINQMKNNI